MRKAEMWRREGEEWFPSAHLSALTEPVSKELTASRAAAVVTFTLVCGQKDGSTL